MTLQTVQNNPFQDLRIGRKENCTIQARRKKHTVKNLYTANQKGLLIYKTKHKQRGRRHDYKVYKENHPELPKDVMSMYDLGFLGVEKDFPEQKSSLPIKKEKGCELTDRRKRVQQEPFCKEDSDRTCYLQVKEIQDNERYL